MEDNRRRSSLAASKRHQSTLQSLFDACLGPEEIDGAVVDDDDYRQEFSCPFCSEEFDIVGLCCHIDDEHQGEPNNGVCPICASRVGMDMVDHIALQHGSYFKVPQRSKHHRGSSDYHQFMFSMLRKDQSDGSLQSFVEDSSCINAPSNAAPDPLLSSFVINFPVADPLDDRIESADKIGMVNNVSDERMVESIEPSSLCEDIERAQRMKFVQELALSTMFQDIL